MIDVPILVKDALRDGGYHKNYIIDVLNDDETIDFSFDNNNLVSESVKIDERLNTGNEIKFGLCEGTSLEFQYFDKPNILNRRIKVALEVDYPNNGTIEQYSIPMGYFEVKQCPRQASTGIRKVVAYNKLQSDYLNSSIKKYLDNCFSNENTEVSLYNIESLLLENYKINKGTKFYKRWTSTSSTNRHHEISTRTVKFANSDYNECIFNSFRWTDNVWGVGQSINSGGKITIHGISVRDGIYLGGDDGKDLLVGLNFLCGNFEEFERTVFNYFVETLNNANFQNVTGMDLFNDVRETWYNFCGLSILLGDGTIQNYSTVQYQYEEENNITHSCDGTTKDVFNRIYNYNTAASQSPEIKSITCNMPDRWFFGTDAAAFGYAFDGGAGSSVRDRYHVTPTYHPFVPYVYYPDGTLYKRVYSGTEPREDFNKVIEIYKIEDEINEIQKLYIDISKLQECTLRDIISGDYETACQFGKLDRETDLFSGVELNQAKLLPQETLYPNTELVPRGALLGGFKSMYSKLWADEGNIHNWIYLIITYKGLDENQQEVEKTLQRTVNTHGTDNYNCSGNWLFKNLVWTEEQIRNFADTMVEKMRNISWFPFEMWCAGLPYTETGDEIEIEANEETYTSYILQRNLNGIQNLQDTYINGELEIF